MSGGVILGTLALGVWLTGGGIRYRIYQIWRLAIFIRDPARESVNRATDAMLRAGGKHE